MIITRISLSLIFLFFVFSSPAQDREPQVAQAAPFSIGSADLGAVANSVNLFTGEVALPMSLVSLPSRGGLNAGVSISYSSAGVRQQATTWNLDAPTGIMGMGWKLDYPKIVVDHKETGAIEDDEYYLVEGGVSNRLYRGAGTGTDREYHTSNYQFWKIVYVVGFERWEITKADGSLFVYGDKNSSRNTIQYGVRWGNWIGNSSRTAGQLQQPIVWNLSEVKNTWGDKITYEYELVENYVGSASGKKQTEACYLKTITTPSGGQVKLHYNVKLSDEYQEPHTEQAEPDAYQERYEKKYLDHIEVWSDFGMKLKVVRLGYGFVGSGDLTKRVLKAVIPEDTQSQSLPGTQFEYLNSGTSIGCLSRVINSYGGWVRFTYSDGVTVSNSKRNITIDAPSGYAEPNVWQGSDYVVVSWRQLNGGNHEEGNRDLQLNVYQWEGEWMEQNLDTIPNVQHEVPTSSLDHHQMDDFQLGTSKDFFAVLKETYSGNNYKLYLYHKSNLERGKWISTSYTINADPGISLDDLHKPSLLVGDNYVAVHTKWQGDIFSYTWNGTGWNTETLTDLPLSRYEAGSGNNWLVSHSRSGNDKTSLRYHDEQKNWVKKDFTSTVTWEADFEEPSSWWGSNSFLVALAGTDQVFGYTWNENYSSFSQTNFSFITSFSNPVAIVNNSLAGISIAGLSAQFFVRYNGGSWYTTPIKYAYYVSIKDYYFGYTEDVVSWAALSGNDGWRKEFNPNTQVWGSDVSLTGQSGSLHESQLVGRNVNYFGGQFYYKNPDGSWTQIHSISNQLAITAGAPSFSVYDKMNTDTIPNKDSYVLQIKNGDLDDEIQVELANQAPVGNSGFKPYRKLTGLNTLVLAPVLYNIPSGIEIDWEDLWKLQIHRLVNDEVINEQEFYPVILVETNDGEQTFYTSYEYNTTKATAHPSGLTAQFSMVKTIPGSNTASATPYGYTESYFFNGFPSGDSYQAFPSGGNVETHYKKLLGVSYGSKTFDNNNNEVGSSETVFLVNGKPISNGTKSTARAYYVLPISTTQTVEGMTTVINRSYDSNTGMMNSTSTTDLTGTSEVVTTSYKYWWEEYDTDRSENILSGVIETKTTVNSSIVDVQATTWKNWNSLADAPWQSYRWKGTGSGVFSGWSGTGGSDWVKASQIEVRDDYGNVLEASNLAGLKSANVMGYNHTVPVAEVTNSDYSTVKTALGGDTGINNLQSEDGATLQTTLNDLRTDTNLSDALVTTTTYHPLTGLTSGVDPNGLSSTNEFDDALQLETVKDDDDYILEYREYHYKLASSSPQLSVSVNDINPTSGAGNTVITVTSNGSWTTTDHGSSWLSVTPASGNNNANITISYTENTPTTSRAGTITVTGQGLSEDITVDQDGTTNNLTTSTNYMLFFSTADQNFTITSNVSWSISTTYYDGNGWLSVSPSSGANNGTITVSITDPGTGTWEAELNISGGGINRTVDIIYIN